MKKTLIAVLCILPYLSIGQTAWEVIAQNIDPTEYYGVTMANGVVGLVSSSQPMQVDAVVLNGVYDYYQRGRVSNILQVFNHVNMDLRVDGMPVRSDNVENYQQVLDMQTATLKTSFSVGDALEVEHEMLSLRNLPYTALSTVTLRAKKEVEVVPASVISAPDHLRDVQNFFSEIDLPHVRIPLLTSVGMSPSGKYKIAASNSFIFPEEHGEEPVLIHEDRDYNRHHAKFYKTLKAGESYTFSIVSSTISSKQNADPQNEAERLSIYAKLEGTTRLRKRHQDAWAKLWQGNITVEGDEQATRDIRFALYHLYSFARAGTAYSLSPMGLSGLGYNGHVFWDTELWMYPPLLLLQPEIAKSLLEYRFERLEEAKKNAFSHGYAGAMYPWESADDGSEDTPVWALTGTFEHHITGCVGWAFWKYYEVTGDRAWLAERGYPVLKEVADFWASRVDREGPGKYHINNVVGANEWLENIDNNAFTNGIAITVLRYAAEAARALGKQPNPDWEDVADNIPIEQFPDGTTRENSTYDGRMVKQADVNLLSYPLQIVSGEARIRQDLEYYEPRLSPEGPAMGFSVLATLYARLGEPEEAHRLFLKSYQPNQVPPFAVLAETAGGTNPYFATGAGGMLQAVINGMAGLEITEEGVVQLPTKLPKAWKKLTITGVGKDQRTFTVE